MDFTKSVSKDQYIKVLETEIASQENKTEKNLWKAQVSKSKWSAKSKESIRHDLMWNKEWGKCQ